MSETPSIKVRIPQGLLTLIDKNALHLKCDRSEAIRILLVLGLWRSYQDEPRPLSMHDRLLLEEVFDPPQNMLMPRGAACPGGKAEGERAAP